MPRKITWVNNIALCNLAGEILLSGFAILEDANAKTIVLIHFK